MAVTDNEAKGSYKLKLHRPLRSAQSSITIHCVGSAWIRRLTVHVSRFNNIIGILVSHTKKFGSSSSTSCVLALNSELTKPI